MIDIFTAIAKEILINAAHLTAGSVLAFFAYKICMRMDVNANRMAALSMIAFSSFIGMILPLNIYGIFPVVIAIAAAGLPLYIALPMMISSSLFNLSVPYIEHAFVWSTGWHRIVLAFAAGVLGGLILGMWKKPAGYLIKQNLRYQWEKDKPPGISGWITNSLWSAAPYLIIGAIAHVLISQYVLWSLIEYVTNNPHMSSAAMYFAGLNVVNPLFILTMNIVNMCMNLIFVSGLFAFFKPRGAVLFIGYYAAIALLFGVSAFF